MIKKQMIVIVIIVSIILAGCSNSEVISNVPDDFNFTLEYGIVGRSSSSNTINTYENFLEMDTVEGQVKINFEFKKEDIKKIYEKMNELDIINYSENLGSSRKSPDVIISHNNYSRLRVNYQGEEKEFYWNSHSFPVPTSQDFTEAKQREQTIKEYMIEKNEKDNHLIQLYNISDIANYIVYIMEEYEEIKKIPPKRLYQ